MAKYVIAGKADCPFFAKAEMLADELEKILVSFKAHKIVVSPEKWQDWLQETCQERGWKHNASPLIWKELVDRGGKGLFVGGCDDFLEMAESYYGIRSEKMSEELLEIAKENLFTKQAVEAENEAVAKAINPLRVTITDGASPVSYAVLNSLLSGEVFGHDQDMSVTLLDKTYNKDALQGIALEVQDCAWPLLRNISSTTETSQAFKNSDVILILDEACAVDETLDTTASAKVFKQYAEAIESDAKKSAKILICSQNASINAAVISNYAPSIPKYNICALSRLRENRVKAEIARKLNVNSSGIIDLIIWGNPGNEDYIDISKSQVRGYDGALWAPHIKTFSRPVVEMVHDDNWVSQELLNKANNHGLILKEKNNTCPSMSTGAAILDFMQDWWCASSQQITSMTSLGVISQGWYGVPKDIIFSFPVLFNNGSWQIVDDLEMSDDAMVKIKSIGEDLKKQIDEILEKLATS